MKKYYMAPGEFNLASSMSNFFCHNSNADKKLRKNAGAIKVMCCFSSISEIKSFQ